MLGIAEIAVDDVEMPDEDDDDLADSDLAEALVRLCPHLSPEPEQQIGAVLSSRAKSTLH